MFNLYNMASKSRAVSHSLQDNLRLVQDLPFMDSYLSFSTLYCDQLNLANMYLNTTPALVYLK